MKIERVINSCHECRYLEIVKELNGNTYYAGICEYGSAYQEQNIPIHTNLHPPTIVITSSTQDRMSYPIDIPDNCPLEPYTKTNNEQLII